MIDNTSPDWTNMNEDARKNQAMRMAMEGGLIVSLMEEKEISLSDLEEDFQGMEDSPELIELLTSVVRDLERRGVLKLSLTKATYIPSDPNNPTPR